MRLGLVEQRHVDVGVGERVRPEAQSLEQAGVAASARRVRGVGGQGRVADDDDLGVGRARLDRRQCRGQSGRHRRVDLRRQGVHRPGRGVHDELLPAGRVGLPVDAPDDRPGGRQRDAHLSNVPEAEVVAADREGDECGVGIQRVGLRRCGPPADGLRGIDDVGDHGPTARTIVEGEAELGREKVGVVLIGLIAPRTGLRGRERKPPGRGVGVTERDVRAAREVGNGGSGGGAGDQECRDGEEGETGTGGKETTHSADGRASRTRLPSDRAQRAWNSPPRPPWHVVVSPARYAPSRTAATTARAPSPDMTIE
ncbi:hypothetical protein SRABI128_06213 [Microbacterium sp. Bi128]|nr:hypothetical protein SRABI128_06213 [Microbacterium sp. Bi128]